MTTRSRSEISAARLFTSTKGNFAQALVIGDGSIVWNGAVLGNFPVLIELRTGHLFWLRVNERTIPDRAMVDRIAASLKAMVGTGASSSAGQIEDHLCEENHISTRVCDLDIESIANWNLSSVVAQRVIADLRNSIRSDSQTLRTRLEEELNLRIAEFISRIDARALAATRAIGSLRPTLYNFMIGPSPTIGKFRAQAATVMPLSIARILASDDPMSKKLRQTIDHGKPLFDSIAVQYRVPRSAAQALAGVRPAWISEPDKFGLDVLVRLIADIEPSYRPRNEADWRKMFTTLGAISKLSRRSLLTLCSRIWIRHIARKGFSVPFSVAEDIEGAGQLIEQLLAALSDALNYDLSSQKVADKGVLIASRAVQQFTLSMGLDRLSELARRYRDCLRHEEQSFLVEKEQLIDANWPSPLASPWAIGTLSVVPILSPEELHREGVVMKNCIETYSSNCAHGKCQIFSIRDENQRSLSSIETTIWRNPNGRFELRIMQHQAFGNTPPESRLKDAANLFAGFIALGGPVVESYWVWKMNIAVLSASERKTRASIVPRLRALRSALPKRHSLKKLLANAQASDSAKT